MVTGYAQLGLRPCDLVPLPGRSLTLAVPYRTASVSERPVAKEQFLAVKALGKLPGECEWPLNPQHGHVGRAGAAVPGARTVSQTAVAADAVRPPPASGGMRRD